MLSCHGFWSSAIVKGPVGLLFHSLENQVRKTFWLKKVGRVTDIICSLFFLPCFFSNDKWEVVVSFYVFDQSKLLAQCPTVHFTNLQPQYSSRKIVHQRISKLKKLWIVWSDPKLAFFVIPHIFEAMKLFFGCNHFAPLFITDSLRSYVSRWAQVTAVQVYVVGKCVQRKRQMFEQALNIDSRP